MSSAHSACMLGSISRQLRKVASLRDRPLRRIRTPRRPDKSSLYWPAAKEV